MVSCGYNTKDNSSSEMRCGFPQAAEAARRGARPPKPLHVPSFKVLCLLSTTGAAVRTNWKTPWATGCWEPSTCEVVSEAAGHGAEHAPCSAITRQRHPIQASVRAGCALTGPCPARRVKGLEQRTVCTSRLSTNVILIWGSVTNHLNTL